MAKITDLATTTGIDWSTQPSHVIDFDPSADLQTINGKTGPFVVIPVKENGHTINMSLSNKSLIKGLRPFDKPTRLRITRTGSNFDTKYTVEKVA